MVKPDEIDLFDGLSRNVKLRAWLNDEVLKETKTLVQAVDIDQLRRAQGRAGAWQTMLRLMDECPGVTKR
jgi:hypothetical protein